MPTLNPLGDRVLIDPVPVADEVRESGLIVQDRAQLKATQEGTVLATGPGRTVEDGTTVPMRVKAGDTVLFMRYTGTEIKLEGKDYLMMTERDILATVSE